MLTVDNKSIAFLFPLYIYSDNTKELERNISRGYPRTFIIFTSGWYRVCEKWLKDRKGRMLTEEDIEHYQKAVVALDETIRIMKEIDVVIDGHGGWPVR